MRMVRETKLTRKLLVGRSAGRLEHGEEASDAHGDGVGVGGGGGGGIGNSDKWRDFLE